MTHEEFYNRALQIYKREGMDDEQIVYWLGELINDFKSAQQSVQSDVATHCACGLALLPDGTCPTHFQYTTQRR